MKLYGKNPVLERLKTNPKSIQRIFIEEGHSETAYVNTKARKWGIPVIMVPSTKMSKMARDVNAQGIIVDVEGFAYVPFDEVLEQAKAKNITPILLDNLNDPQNLGSIIRSAACLGRFALVLPTHDSVSITEAVLRVASGGDNHITVSQISNLGQAISKAKKEGFWIAGSVVEEGENLYEAELPFPLVLVVGSEQKGIRDIIRKQLDVKLNIPMAHPRLSLNVAQAVTAFCYEITKQKNRKNP